MQAAMDRLHLSDGDFADVLCEELYSTAKAALSTTQWTRFVRIMDSRHLGRVRVKEWRAFKDDISNLFPHCTSLGIASTIAEVSEDTSAPTGILSFNAEPLLAALINANVAIRRGKRYERDVVDYVTHATSDRKLGRIPYVFCHGLLPIPDVSGGKPLGSVDKLVFSESAYLSLANNSFSWQSASFLRAAALHSIVFIGVSLSDPNMRRWLSWVHAVRVAELTEVGAPSPTSTVHYWLTKAPLTDEEKMWTEALVAHLGVRVVWVQDYSEIVPTLRAMLGLNDSPGGTPLPAV